MISVMLNYDNKKEAERAVENLNQALVGWDAFINDEVVVSPVRDNSHTDQHYVLLTIGKQIHPKPGCDVLIKTENVKVLKGKPNK